MKQIIVTGGLIFLGISAWLLGSKLSSDALGMAVGVTFGIIAGLPTALLVLLASRRDRRRWDDDDDDYRPRDRRPQLPPAQPPVIVYVPQQLPAQTHNHAPVQHNYYVAPQPQEWQPPSVQAPQRTRRLSIDMRPASFVPVPPDAEWGDDW